MSAKQSSIFGNADDDAPNAKAKLSDDPPPQKKSAKATEIIQNTLPPSCTPAGHQSEADHKGGAPSYVKIFVSSEDQKNTISVKCKCSAEFGGVLACLRSSREYFSLCDSIVEANTNKRVGAVVDFMEGESYIFKQKDPTQSCVGLGASFSTYATSAIILLNDSCEYCLARMIGIHRSFQASLAPTSTPPQGPNPILSAGSLDMPRGE